MLLMFSLGKRLSKNSPEEGENRMRVLITLHRNRTHRYLVNLAAKSLIARVRDLVSDQEYAKAVDYVYEMGLLEKEILEEELPALHADLILSDCRANWDVKR